MKRYLIVFSIATLICLITPLTIKAETSLSDIYISVTDAKLALQDKDNHAFDKYFKEIKDNWQKTNKKEHKLVQKINNDIDKVEKSKSTKEKEQSLNALTSNLIDYEKVLNPVDKQKKRNQLQNEIQPLIKNISKAISDKDFEKAKSINNQLNANWTKNEKIVREEDIGRYGQIETALMFVRIELTKDKVDATSAQMQVDQLKKELDEYHAGNKSGAKSANQDATILNKYLDQAISNIKNDDLAKAKQDLQQFIIVWPNVESEISTKNGALYTKIEQKIPQYVGQLEKDNKDEIQSNLETINQEIKSSLASWQNFINKNMDKAMSTGSIITFGLVAFLSVFREGAETIIFYLGIVGKISTWSLILGIIVALIILAVIAIFFNQITKWIPIHRLFLIMSLFIFILAFKILGVSIHTLQILNILPQHTINKLPFIDLVGFYPTYETLITQLLLVVIVGVYYMLRSRK